MLRLKDLYLTIALLSLMALQQANACTGITLHANDGGIVLARTIEWGGSYLDSKYIIVPRGYTQNSYTPDGGKNGMEYTARYGYAGLAVEKEEFIAEGLNEAGLSAGLFYFPGYGKYVDYEEERRTSSISDFQLVAWMLGNFKSVEEVVNALDGIRIIGIDPRAGTAHWRIADTSGRQVVLEIMGGKHVIYENKLEILTNSPGFEWQMTNLNNYINLTPGTTKPKSIDGKGMKLSSFGAGSGFLGMPGDVTPPSRFVRAAFYQNTASIAETSEKAVMQGFQILNNFDIPIGIEFAEGEKPTDIPSATQWTSAADLMNKKIYYRTMYDSTIRCIDIGKIDFSSTKYRAAALDRYRHQPIIYVK